MTAEFERAVSNLEGEHAAPENAQLLAHSGMGANQRIAWTVPDDVNPRISHLLVASGLGSGAKHCSDAVCNGSIHALWWRHAVSEVVLWVGEGLDYHEESFTMESSKWPGFSRRSIRR